MRSRRSVFGIMVAAIDIVGQWVSRSRARWRLPDRCPLANQPRNHQRTTKILGHGTQKADVSPRCEWGIAGIVPPINCLSEGVLHIVDRHRLQDFPDDSQVFESRTVLEVA